MPGELLGKYLGLLVTGKVSLYLKISSMVFAK
jgi:hypothetical protein